MRTKALLLAAAAFAAGIVSTMAQVYSANVVGFYNVNVPAGGFQLVANQLTDGKGNSVNSALSTGLTSDPNGINNTVLYSWTGSGYAVFQYFNSADAVSYFGTGGLTNAWYDSIGNVSSATLNPGGGSFLYNPSSGPVNLTVLGTVVEGTNNISVTAGFNIYSILQPVSTNFDGSFANFPGTSDPNGVNNDLYYYWTGSGYGVFQYFTSADANTYFGATSGNGWYDSIGNYVSSNPTYQPKVGQAFFIYHTGSPVTWTYSFSSH